jgi:hypothetical protein
MHLEDGLDIGAPFHYRSYPLYRRSCALLSARPPARIRGAHVLEGIIARAGDCPSKFGTCSQPAKNRTRFGENFLDFIV